MNISQNNLLLDVFSTSYKVTYKGCEHLHFYLFFHLFLMGFSEIVNENILLLKYIIYVKRAFKETFGFDCRFFSVNV